ncbi:MAG: bifunctional 23S rRNA (guanine(2069)-N(7))-methyltransferase RlmK/23S rRNA (guanine(2445)-N(2))-methyltransferase RlmL [Thermoguttaceae bacterium]|nr:bifunctional 23S rRNA (guanine(2069)-N(7))-methyltransferase RlmK/23S rRNA (guanine(2445)-N(2))-methyltransferase RlmL [Thermoguttaceae bacterium]
MQLQLIATSTTGLESVVAQELKDLGLSPRNSDFAIGRTHFEGDFSDLIKANLWLRCAGKILVQLAEFDVSNDFDVIFDAVKAIEWESWAPRNANFHVEGRSVRSKITSVPALQRTVKKAIVDRLCGVWGLTSLPETGPTYTVEISLLKDRATLTLDSTGRGLHRRGYRLMNVVAPLREPLAAALVKLSVWRPGRPLIDPFCASGTIPIEAALIGRNIAPGLKRSFDAEGWPLIPRNLWDEAREEARAAIRPTLGEKIYGSDIDETSLKFARQHAVNAGVDEDVVFKRRDFRDLTDDREYGCVVCNPPYGERLGDVAQLRPLYESIPAVLSKLPTWSHYIITSWRDFEKTIGQEATRRRKLYNSRVECVYYQFLGPKPPRDFDFAAAPAVDFENGENRSEIVSSVEDTPQNAGFSDAFENNGTETEIEKNADSSDVAARSEHSERSANAPAFAGLDAYADRIAEEFGRCLANRARHLRRWPSRGITCYRLYDKDLPEVPLAIDIFEGRWLHVAEYDRHDERTVGQKRLWIDKMVAKAAEILNIEPQNVFFKRRVRQRGSAQYEKLDETGRVVKVNEGGLSFLCNLTDYLDVGLFLDHRETRQMARKEANGKRFLNLFCYSGAFTSYAADGGASSLVSVDLSPTYLDWCEANMEENGFYVPSRAREARRAGFDVKQTVDSLYVKSDVLRFLRAIPPASDRNRDIVRLIEETAAEVGDVRTVGRRDGGGRFGRSNGGASQLGDRAKYFKNKTKDGRAERGSLPDRPFGLDRSDFELCVCDPPTFSNSKSTDADWDVQRRHVELLRLLATRMKPGGVVYFSNNYRRFKLDEESLTDLYDFREISNRTVPEDFRNKRIHRCWRMIAK